MEIATMIDLAFLLGLGLSGSLHCAGMCGGIACTYAIPVSQWRPQVLWRYHTFYFFGRLLAYGWIGAFMGALGMSFQWLGPQSPFQNLAIWLAGSLMIVGGAAAFIGQTWPQKLGGWVAKTLNFLVPSLRQWSQSFRPWRAIPLGMLSGILPCGLMWAVEARAMATHSIFWGMVTMLIFCTITTPSLIFTSTIMTKLSPALRYRSVQLAGILVILMGLHLLWTHWGGHVPHLHAH